MNGHEDNITKLSRLINEAHNPPIEGNIDPQCRLEDFDIDLEALAHDVWNAFDIDFSEDMWDECHTVQDVLNMIKQCQVNGMAP